MMSLICEILKNDTNELTDKTEIDSNTANKFMVTKGKSRGKAKFGINRYITLYKINSLSLSLSIYIYKILYHTILYSM